MPLRSLLLLVSALTALAAEAGHAQEPIARIKSAPQDYRDRQIQIEGEVIEVRALSPRSARGAYRVVDESDPVGVLVRTANLPETGGPFRIRVRLSPELLQDGVLVVEELDRSLARIGVLPVATGIGVIGLVAFIALFMMYLRTRRAERQLRLAPPMWLIPSAVEEPKAAEAADHSATPTHFNYRLHYIEQERSASIERQKRRLVIAVAGAAIVAVAGTGWSVMLRQADAAKPAFVLLTPDPIVTAAQADTAPVDTAAGLPGRPDDTLRVALATPTRPAAAPPALRRDTTRRPVPRDTVTAPRQPAAARQETTPFRQDTARAGEAVVVVTGPARETAAAAAPTVTPPPPPPVTPTVRRDTAPTIPRPDPVALLRAATTELEGGIQRFVAALEGKQVGTVAVIYRAGGDARREPFLEFLRQSSPSATLRGSDQPTVTTNAAEAGFTVGFRWRAAFGVERRKDVRFGATARRSGDGWVFENVRLLEAFP